MCAESQDAAKPTAPRWGLRVAIGLGVVAVVALAFLAARWVGQRSSLSLQAWFYTDADTIKTPAAEAPLRDILWQPARPLPWEIINTTDDDYEPRLSADGLTLFFVRGKAGQNADIYFSEAAGDGWTEPEPVVGVNSSFDDLGPEPSADGKSLYFYSDRPGGQPAI